MQNSYCDHRNFDSVTQALAILYGVYGAVNILSEKSNRQENLKVFGSGKSNLVHNNTAILGRLNFTTLCKSR